MSDNELEQVFKSGKENIKPSAVKKNTARRVKDWENLEKKVAELEKDVSYWQNTAERYLKQLELVNVKLINYELGNQPQTVEQGTQTELKEKNINALLKQRDDIICWAKELGIDTGKKWDLSTLKSHYQAKISQLEQNTITPAIQEKLQKYEQWETIIGLLKERQELRKELGIF